MTDTKSPRLGREDIVGRRVREILRSPDHVSADGYGSHAVYVELDTGPMFELPFRRLDVDAEPIESISRWDVPPHLLRSVSERVRDACHGMRIDEVVVSEYWASVGLLLENGIILAIGDCGVGFVGAVVYDTHTDDWQAEEYRPLWPKAG